YMLRTQCRGRRDPWRRAGIRYVGMSVGLGCDPVVCESVVTTAVGFAGGDFETKTCPFLFQYGAEVLFWKQKHASFCFKMGKHAQSADTLISDRIQSRGPGWVF